MSFEAQWGVVTPNPPRGYATGSNNEKLIKAKGCVTGYR